METVARDLVAAHPPRNAADKKFSYFQD